MLLTIAVCVSVVAWVVYRDGQYRRGLRASQRRSAARFRARQAALLSQIRGDAKYPAPVGRHRK